MTKPLFPKWFIYGTAGFFIALIVLTPVHFWMLSRHTGDVEQGVKENEKMAQQLEKGTLFAIERVLAKYREDIKKMEEFNARQKGE